MINCQKEKGLEGQWRDLHFGQEKRMIIVEEKGRNGYERTEKC